MGARGLGAARSAIAGSVSHWLLVHAPVPVTVVKHAAAEVEEEEGEEDQDEA
jgi:nucleotide-binding universal stress UspA family protein